VPPRAELTGAPLRSLSAVFGGPVPRRAVRGREGRRSKELLTEAGVTLEPKWQSVTEALAGLDGQTRTQLTLSRGADCNCIAVGGGHSGQYHVFIYTADERNVVLGNGTSEETAILMRSGGQSACLGGRS
jgi:hypothetical protein